MFGDDSLKVSKKREKRSRKQIQKEEISFYYLSEECVEQIGKFLNGTFSRNNVTIK